MCMSWKGASQMRKRSGLSRTQFLVQWVALPVLVIVSAAMFVTKNIRVSSLKSCNYFAFFSFISYYSIYIFLR